MAVERAALVVRTDPANAWVSPLAACSSCGGCNGRCDWLADDASASALRLPQELFAQPPVPGQRVRLCWESPALLSVAIRAYGWPLVGLLAGAVLSTMLNTFLRSGDVGVLLGALAGTLVGIARSKRALAAIRQLRVLPASCDTGPTDLPRST